MRLFSDICCIYEVTSVFTSSMPRIQSTPCSHKYRIRKLILCYNSTAVPGRLLGWFASEIKSSPLLTTWPGLMKGLSCTWVGVRDLMDRSVTPSRSLLLQDVARSPFLNLWNARLWIRPLSPCNSGACLEVLWNIRGIRHTSVPGSRDLLHSPWKIQRRATPPSYIRGGGGDLPLAKVTPL